MGRKRTERGSRWGQYPLTWNQKQGCEWHTKNRLVILTTLLYRVPSLSRKSRPFRSIIIPRLPGGKGVNEEQSCWATGAYLWNTMGLWSRNIAQRRANEKVVNKTLRLHNIWASIQFDPCFTHPHLLVCYCSGVRTVYHSAVYDRHGTTQKGLVRKWKLIFTMVIHTRPWGWSGHGNMDHSWSV